jgi:type II secretory pathway component PulF
MMLLKALTVSSGAREGELDAMLDSAAELLARRGGVLG